jgi:hypothetical protein
VRRVRRALDAGPQVVHARVSGHAARRTLTWRVTPALAHGQQLQLDEGLAPGATLAATGSTPAGAGTAGRPLVTTARSSGRLAFRPEDGHGEARVVRATIVTDGLARPPAIAARFTAPRAVPPGAPARVALRRQGRHVTLAWRARRGARPTAWRVQVAVGAGRSIRTEVAGTKHALRVDGVPAALGVRAQVAGATAGGLTGRSRTAALRPGALRSGAASGGAARPRALRVRHAGHRLALRWHAGAERVAGFAVTVRVGGGRALRLHAAGGRPRLVVRGVPARRARVRVVVRPERFDGRSGPALRFSGRR